MEDLAHLCAKGVHIPLNQGHIHHYCSGAVILFFVEESKRLSQCSLEKYPEQKQGLQEVILVTQQPRPTHCLILDNVLLDTHVSS